MSGDDYQSLQGFRPHRWNVALVVVSAFFPGAVHGDGDIPHERIGIFTVAGIDGNPNVGNDMEYGIIVFGNPLPPKCARLLASSIH
jgi:hypothetical protein